MTDARPTKYFAHPPYRAEDLGGKMGWWGVMNRNEFYLYVLHLIFFCVLLNEIYHS